MVSLARRIRNGAVVVKPTRRVRDRVVSETCVVVVTQFIGIRLALDESFKGTQAVGSVSTSSASDLAEWENTVVQSHPDELVGGVCRIVSVLRGSIVLSLVGHRSRVRAAAANDFGDELGCERSQVRKDEVSVRVWWVLC